MGLSILAVIGHRSSPSLASGSFGHEGSIVVNVSVDRGDGVYDSDLVTFGPDGSTPKNVTDQAFTQSDASWSPDGSRLLYKTEAGLHVMRAGGSGSKRILSFRPGEPYYRYPSWPSWSPDGSSIVYVEALWDPDAGRYGGSNLVVISPSGKKLRRLGSYEGVAMSPSWSPDGSQITFWMCEVVVDLVVARNGDCRVHVVSADGDRQRALGRDVDPADSWPAWSPDGRLLFLGGDSCPPVRSGSCVAIYRMEADGSEVELLAPAQDWTGDGTIDEYLRVVSSPGASSRLLVSLVVEGDYQGQVWLWDMKTDRRTHLYTGPLLYTLDWQPRCTVRGTPGSDTLVGTPDRDLICGLGGDDSIQGLGGNDVIFGHGGDDRIAGGTGADIVVGGPGRDRCDRDREDHSHVC